MTEEQRKACVKEVWVTEALALLRPGVNQSEELLVALQLRGLTARMTQLSGKVMAGLEGGAGSADRPPPNKQLTGSA